MPCAAAGSENAAANAATAMHETTFLRFMVPPLCGLGIVRSGLEHFFEGREALRDLGGARDPQWSHARLVRGLRELRDVGLVEDQALDVAGHLHDLVDADAAHVAGVAALEAADRPVDFRGRRRLERRAQRVPEAMLVIAMERHLLLAVRAKGAHQALR